MRSSRTYSTMGFTLMEMLVVVSMIAIMSLFAWPKVVTMYNQSQVRSARTAAHNLFEAARVNARMNGTRITFNQAGNVLWISNTATGARLGSVSVWEEFKTTASGTASLGVDPRGLAGPGTFVFTRGNAVDSLVIVGYGRVVR